MRISAAGCRLGAAGWEPLRRDLAGSSWQFPGTVGIARLGDSLGAFGGEATKFELGMVHSRGRASLLGGMNYDGLGRASVGWQAEF